LTVAEAIEEHFADRLLRGKARGIETDRASLAAHVLPTLGEVTVAKLTAKQLKAWQRTLATTPARLRSSRDAEERNYRGLETEEQRKARRSTVNRVWGAFRAALAHAAAEHHISDEAWRGIKSFPNAATARVRYLSDDEALRLCNAAQGDLRDLIVAGLLCGARYGEITNLVADDFNPDSGTLTIRAAIAKSGKTRHIALAPEGVAFFARLRTKTAPGALLFTRNGKQWTRSVQERPLAEACQAAGIARLKFHELRHSYASRLVMRGVPMAVVSSLLGHSSVAITEKFYAHLAPSFVADSVRAAIGALGIVPAGNVRSFTRSA
jgi:integrase